MKKSLDTYVNIKLEVRILKNNLYVIKSVVDYIENHLDKRLDLDGISKGVGYSKYHLHRLFTGIIGMTAHNYIQRRRLTEAARLLISTDKSIIDIALWAGYESQQAFTDGFKKMFKNSPKRYRNKGIFSPHLVDNVRIVLSQL